MRCRAVYLCRYYLYILVLFLQQFVLNFFDDKYTYIYTHYTVPGSVCSYNGYMEVDSLV